MTMQSLDTILDRIAVAEWDSPIIVYGPQVWETPHKTKRVPKPRRYLTLDAMFYNTVITERNRVDGKPLLVGIFTRHYKKDWVISRLMKAKPAPK